MASAGMEEAGRPTQCLFCRWKDTNILLEGHIREKHSEYITNKVGVEYKLSYTLKCLEATSGWQMRVVEHDAMLFVFSVKFEKPGYLLTCISSIAPIPHLVNWFVEIKLYNKITNKPEIYYRKIVVPTIDEGMDYAMIDLTRLGVRPVHPVPRVPPVPPVLPVAPLPPRHSNPYSYAEELDLMVPVDIYFKFRKFR